MKYGVLGVAALLCVSATQALAQAQVQAQVRDAVYRGTLVCDKLPFFETTSREALEVKVSGSDAKDVLIVRERKETSFEQGAGKLDGEKISLTGSWSGDSPPRPRFQAAVPSGIGGSILLRSADSPSSSGSSSFRRMTFMAAWSHPGPDRRRS